MKTEELIRQAEMSPCVGVCKLDEETGWCFGCGRTRVEIRGWRHLPEEERASLEASLVGRVSQLIEQRRQQRGARRSGRRQPD